MTAPLIVPIVEGHGETEAVPLLLRRFAAEKCLHLYLEVNKPIRVKSGSFLSDERYFEKYIRLATAKAAQGNGTVLILLDCEDDCPGRLGPDILSRAKRIRSDIEYLVVLAFREYETWFIAAARSLGKYLDLPEEHTCPMDLDAIRGAKEWLARRMRQKYDPLIHQAVFSSKIDIDQASASLSFRRFRDKIHDYSSSRALDAR
jgi:hypothetical protein